MDEFIVIKVMNEAMQRLLKEKGKSTINNDKIKEYLEDEAFFYKIRKESALKVLFCVGIIKEHLNITYEKLVCPVVYNRLIKEGKLNPADPKVIIKFN